MTSRALLLCLTIIFWPGIGSAAPYDYPFTNAFEATVLGTPPSQRAVLPDFVPIEEKSLAPIDGRAVPEVFWYWDSLRYSVALQETPAPLIFLIAGTGGSHRSANLQGLQKAFYGAGFHTVALPSPTHGNFIVTASSSGMPGQLREDADDLYRVMRRIYAELSDRIDVTAFHVTGYSLGASNAVYLAELDETERAFDFERVLMINPPVSLYGSIGVLDRMLEANLPGGISRIDEFLDYVLAQYSEIYIESDVIEFDDELLYELYRRKSLDESTLAALVGLTFRLSASNLVFTSDVLTDHGHVVPRNRELTATSSLSEYLWVTIHLGFQDYVEDLLLQHYQATDESLTLERMIHIDSLESLEPYISDNEKIGLVTNEDDVILRPGDVDYLKGLFADRAKIYPTGGHCGNLLHRDVVAHIIDFFTR